MGGRERGLTGRHGKKTLYKKKDTPGLKKGGGGRGKRGEDSIERWIQSMKKRNQASKSLRKSHKEFCQGKKQPEKPQRRQERGGRGQTSTLGKKRLGTQIMGGSFSADKRKETRTVGIMAPE